MLKFGDRNIHKAPHLVGLPAMLLECFREILHIFWGEHHQDGFPPPQTTSSCSFGLFLNHGAMAFTASDAFAWLNLSRFFQRWEPYIHWLDLPHIRSPNQLLPSFRTYVCWFRWAADGPQKFSFPVFIILESSQLVTS